MTRKNKFIPTLFTLGLLLVSSIILTFISIVLLDKAVLVLSFNHNKSTFTTSTYSKLTKGHKLSGEFEARENNLGIVAIRFQSFMRIPYKDEDTLVFRIKEKGEKAWYYSNTYRSGLTYDVPFLPFGFPKIDNSKGKTYVFELVSLDGNEINGVALSKRMPNLVTRYQADKSILLHNPKELLIFLAKKFYNSFQTLDIRFSALVFSLPFLIYLLFLPSIHKYWWRYIDRVQKRSRTIRFIKEVLNKTIFSSIYGLQAFTVIVWFLLVANILFLQVQNSVLFAFIFFVEIFLFCRLRYSPTASYYFGIFLLLLTPTLLFNHMLSSAELSTAWAFIYLSLAVVESLFQFTSIYE